MVTLLGIPADVAQGAFEQFFNFLDTIPGAFTAFSEFTSRPEILPIWEWIYS